MLLVKPTISNFGVLAHSSNNIWTCSRNGPSDVEVRRGRAAITLVTQCNCLAGAPRHGRVVRGGDEQGFASVVVPRQRSCAEPTLTAAHAQVEDGKSAKTQYKVTTSGPKDA